MNVRVRKLVSDLGEKFWLSPALLVGGGILLAFVCVGTLVFFVGHMASRINVDMNRAGFVGGSNC